MSLKSFKKKMQKVKVGNLKMIVDCRESAETDVDKVLKAARLTRHEKQALISEDTAFMIFVFAMMFLVFALYALMIVCH